MLATSTAGLLPSARLLLPRAIHETGAGTWNGPPCDANGAPRMSRGHAQPEEPGGKLKPPGRRPKTSRQPRRSAVWSGLDVGLRFPTLFLRDRRLGIRGDVRAGHGQKPREEAVAITL